MLRCIVICSCHGLYNSFWKGFESDQRWLLNNIAGLRLLVWRIVNKQDAQVSSHVSNIVMELSISFGDDLGFRGKLIVNNIRNVRRNLSVLFTTRQTSKLKHI